MKLRALAALLLSIWTGLVAQTPPAPAPKLFAVRLTTGPAWDAAKPPVQNALRSARSIEIKVGV